MGMSVDASILATCISRSGWATAESTEAAAEASDQTLHKHRGEWGAGHRKSADRLNREPVEHRGIQTEKQGRGEATPLQRRSGEASAPAMAGDIRLQTD